MRFSTALEDVEELRSSKNGWIGWLNPLDKEIHSSALAEARIEGWVVVRLHKKPRGPFRIPVSNIYSSWKRLKAVRSRIKDAWLVIYQPGHFDSIRRGAKTRREMFQCVVWFLVVVLSILGETSAKIQLSAPPKSYATLQTSVGSNSLISGESVVGDIPPGVQHFTASPLQAGEAWNTNLLVFGGWNQCTAVNDLYLLVPKTVNAADRPPVTSYEWSLKTSVMSGDIPTPLSGSVSALFLNRYFIVHGGFQGGCASNTATNLMFFMDSSMMERWVDFWWSLATFAWTQVTQKSTNPLVPVPSGRALHSGLVMTNFFYIYGGNVFDNELYAADLGLLVEGKLASWYRIPTLSSSRSPCLVTGVMLVQPNTATLITVGGSSTVASADAIWSIDLSAFQRFPTGAVQTSWTALPISTTVSLSFVDPGTVFVRPDILAVFSKDQIWAKSYEKILPPPLGMIWSWWTLQEWWHLQPASWRAKTSIS